MAVFSGYEDFFAYCDLFVLRKPQSSKEAMTDDKASDYGVPYWSSDRFRALGQHDKYHVTR